jgi:hypothetical protein
MFRFRSFSSLRLRISSHLPLIVIALVVGPEKFHSDKYLAQVSQLAFLLLVQSLQLMVEPLPFCIQSV